MNDTTQAKVTTFYSRKGRWHVGVEVSSFVDGIGYDARFTMTPDEARKMAADLLAMAQDCAERDSSWLSTYQSRATDNGGRRGG